MRSLSPLCLLLLLLLPRFSSAVEPQLYSVSPATAHQGARVSIMGADFNAATRVILGGEELTPSLLGNTQLQLLVPPFAEGEYSLRLTDGVVMSSQSLNLRIELPPPEIVALTPSNIDECSNPEEREVTIRGRNFQPGATVLLNGSAVRSSVDDNQLISFSAPKLEAGIYGLQVVNPNGKRSLPHSLYFNNIPKIFNVSEGDNYVGSYQLQIEGKNFYHQSSLVVREFPSGFADTPPQQQVIHGRAGAGGAGMQAQLRSDYLNYVDCGTLIYYRVPYSGQDKELTLQIVNQDGKSSAPFPISTP